MCKICMHVNIHICTYACMYMETGMFVFLQTCHDANKLPLELRSWAFYTYIHTYIHAYIHQGNRGVQEEACFALANVAGEPENIPRIISGGGLEAVLNAMAIHQVCICDHSIGCMYLHVYLRTTCCFRTTYKNDRKVQYESCMAVSYTYIYI
jgi:hypothetical protein